MPDLLPTSSVRLTGTGTAPGRQVTFPRSWRFDFGKGDFALTPRGAVTTSRETEAWLEWCRKALQTERYMHLAYGRSYGQEFADLISRGLTRAGNEAEIARMVRDSLSVDDRTADVTAFTFRWLGDVVEFTCQVTSVRGDAGALSGKVVVE